MPEYNQDEWRRCSKCQVLAWAGGPSEPCADGGSHDFAGSGNHLVELTVGADKILHDAYMQALKPKAL